MVILNKNLINKIMLYVSHPCADIIKSCKCEYIEDVIVLRTQNKFIRCLDRFSSSTFVVKNKTSVDDELKYEEKVIESVVYNKLNVWCLIRENLLLLCPEYVHFNREIIDKIIHIDRPRLERCRMENDPYYGMADPYDNDNDSDSDM